MIRHFIVALRPKQWSKNLILFGPLIFSLNLTDLGLLARAGAAFALFCAVSGAVYLMNDVVDREQDRQHPIKRLRPVASGALSPLPASIGALILGAAAVAAAFFMDVLFGIFMLSYVVNNLLYSYVLKHVVIIDVGSIAAGFVLRVLAGAAVINVDASPWLVMCTILLAAFLGFAKRRHELLLLAGAEEDHRRVLLEYNEQLLDQMILISAASTVMSYALYTVSERVSESFGTTNLIYTVPFVLYGLFRYLYLVHVRNSGGNPSKVLLNDAPLMVCILLWLAACCAIVYGS